MSKGTYVPERSAILKVFLVCDECSRCDSKTHVLCKHNISFCGNMTNLSYYLEQKHPMTCLIDFHGANFIMYINCIKYCDIYRIVTFFQVIGDSSFAW